MAYDTGAENFSTGSSADCGFHSVQRMAEKNCDVGRAHVALHPEEIADIFDATTWRLSTLSSRWSTLPLMRVPWFQADLCLNLALGLPVRLHV